MAKPTVKQFSDDGAFNIDAFDTKTPSDDGIEFQIELPSGPAVDKAGNPVWIKLGFFDGPRMRQIWRDGRAAREKQHEEKRKKDPKFEYTVEQQAKEDLALMTIGWSDNWVDRDGQKVPCNYDTALGLYERYPAIAEQLAAKLRDRANFFPVASSE